MELMSIRIMRKKLNLVCLVSMALLSAAGDCTAQLIPKNAWSLMFTDSEELAAFNGRGGNAFDGDPLTFWHTAWVTKGARFPHEIQIDLGARYDISGFGYLPRQDGSRDGWIKAYQFYVSPDGKSWGRPVARGRFVGDAAEKTVGFKTVRGRYVRLRASSEINRKKWTSAAEINVLGVPVDVNQPPDGVITAPPADVSIKVGQTVTFAGDGVDADGHLPLTYRWSYGAGSGIPDSTLQNPGAVQFNAAGTFSVTMTVADSLGLADPSPAVRTIVVTEASVNQAPNGVIVTPSASLTVNAGDSVYFTGAGTDPDDHQPLTCHWNFGAGSTVSASTSLNPGLIRFVTPGVYTVAFTVTDGLGLADPTPDTRTVTVESPTAALIPQETWSVKYASSEELAGEDGSAENAIDGNPGTFWHTMWRPYSLSPPHELQIDLGGMYTVSGFRVLPRQDGSKSGRVSQYELYVSTDGADWGNAVATGTFADSAAEKQVTFAPRLGQYVRFRSVSGDVNGNPWASAAELRVLGVPVRPSLRIVTPPDGALQTGTNLLVRVNASLNAAAHGGWGVRFLLDGGPSHGGRVMDRYAAPYEATFTGVARAEHVVEGVLIDSAGNEVSTPETRDQSVPVGVGDFTVAIGDSITAGSQTGFGDDFPDDDTSWDGRNTGGGYVPVLNNLLTDVRGVPQMIVNHGVGGATSSYGASLAPVVVSKWPEARRYLILYGMNDANPLLPIPSGRGLAPGDAGYPGSFKDNLQRMVAAVKGAGKAPALARINIALGDCNDGPQSCPPYPSPDTGARNLWIQEYNLVIDELVADPANGIAVSPPDLYGYFRLHYPTEYFDNFHPNGMGYRSVAQLWCQMLTGAPCEGE